MVRFSMRLGRAVAEERLASPWLVDRDVEEVYRALSATMKTLSSGIYYESLPEGAGSDCRSFAG